MGNLAGHEEWDKSLDEDGHVLNGTLPLSCTIISCH